MCGGGHVQASDSVQGTAMIAQGSTSSGNAGGGSSRGFNSGLYGSEPDLNSPGSTRKTGKSSAGNTDTGKSRQGGGADSGQSATLGSSVGKSSSGSGSSRHRL